MPKGVVQNFKIELDKRTSNQIKRIANVEGIDPSRVIENYICKFKDKYEAYINGGSNENIPQFFRDLLPSGKVAQSEVEQSDDRKKSDTAIAVDDKRDKHKLHLPWKAGQ
jgi:uridine kinase